jgi:metal-dependent amidase/aminoacylase/carboxypeptidase family protein
VIRQAAIKKGFPCGERDSPLKFGEDFGWFSRAYSSAMFGLGAGIACTALHHADYDFPEALLETGVAMFQEIITQLLNE